MAGKGQIGRKKKSSGSGLGVGVGAGIRETDWAAKSERDGS